MKRNLYFDPSSINPSPLMNHYRFHKLKTALFTKYFPKYLGSFELSSKPASIRSKVKRTKVIRNFTARVFENSSEWRLLLANKMKCLKNLSNNGQPPIQFIEKIKLFTQLTSIQISFHERLPLSFRQKSMKVYHLAKIWKKIQRLRNIKSLKIIQLANAGASLIQELDSASRLLSSLKTFEISTPKFAKNTTGQLLDTIKNTRSLLKYVTTLQLVTLESPSHFKDFQSLQNLCPNLASLCFEISCKDIFYNPLREKQFSLQRLPVEINFLETLKTFHNLKILNLHIADTFTFLNDFAVPPLIQNLTLNLEECLTKEILLRIDDTFTDAQALQFFGENQTMIKFYNNFRSLKTLETFRMLFSQDCHSEDYQRQNYLLQNILQTIPSLKTLAFVDGFRYSGLNHGVWHPVRDLYFPQLLGSCHHFSQTLQTLEVGHEKITFSNFDLSPSRSTFTNLETIKFTGKFDNLDVGISSFLEEIISLGDSISTIKLNTFVNRTTGSLLSALQQLNQVKRPPNLRVELQLKLLDSKGLEQPEFDLQDLIKELPENLKLQGVSLSILMSENYPEPVKEALAAYGEKFDNFNLRFGSNSFSN